MKSYINNCFLLLLIAISLTLNTTSCSDENFVDEEETTEDITPDTLPYTFATGIISDSYGNPLSNVTIDYLIDGEISNVTTNDQGVYEIRNFDANSNRTPIRCQSEGFLPKLEVLLSKGKDKVEKNIILAREQELSDGPTDQLTPQVLSSSLISVSGRLLSANGEGLEGLSIFISDIHYTTFSYGITDENGNWSIAIEPEERASIHAQTPCIFETFFINDIELLEDIDLDDLLTTIETQPNILNFNGFITDCNTQEGLISGFALFSFSDTSTTIVANVVNGQYGIQIPQCGLSPCVDIKIVSFSALSGVDEFLCQNFVDGQNLMDFEVCNSTGPTINGGYLTMNIDGNITEHELVEVEERYGSLYLITAQNILEDRSLLFATDMISTSGTFQLGVISELYGGQVFNTVEEGAINFQIDSTTTEFMYGNFNGSIIDESNGQSIPIEGEFKAKFK